MYSFIQTWDIYHYFSYASQMLGGIKVAIEYPIGARFIILFPRLLTSDFNIYVLLFYLQTFLVALFGGYLIKRAGRNQWVYWAGVLLLFPLTFERLDLYVAVLILWSVLLFKSNKYFTSGLVLLVGILVKIYPVFILPFYLYKMFRNRVSSKPFIFMVLVGIIGIWGIFRDTYLMNFLSERSPQPESLFTLYFWFRNSIPDTIYAHNSIEYVKTPIDLYLSIVLGVTAVLGLLRAFRIKDIVVGAFYIILAVIIGGRTLSPQYLLWLVVFLPFIKRFNRLVVFSAIFVTMIYLGFYQQAVIEMTYPYFGFLLIRNIFLLLAMI